MNLHLSTLISNRNSILIRSHECSQYDTRSLTTSSSKQLPGRGGMERYEKQGCQLGFRIVNAFQLLLDIREIL